jgi:hypothetical protein
MSDDELKEFERLMKSLFESIEANLDRIGPVEVPTMEDVKARILEETPEGRALRAKIAQRLRPGDWEKVFGAFVENPK